MSDNKYSIFYVGLKKDVSSKDAVTKLSELPKISPEKAKKIIYTKNRVIKSGLRKKDADIYRSCLDKIGLCVEIHEEEDNISNLSVQDKNNNKELPKKDHNEIVPNTPVQQRNNKTMRDENVHRTIQIEFKGQAFEYFKIWIVNIFLTIISLGIYSAWAKVRNTQYFYGNTFIDGSSFNYTAKPISILKGRLIAVGIFGVYAIVSEVSPMVGLAMTLVFMPAIPWLIIRSLTFNAQNSMFRNIRFDFKGKYGEALGVFLLWPLLIICTAGLILPYVLYKQYRFVINNGAFGTAGFDYHAKPKEIYRIFLVIFGSLFMLGLLILGLSTIFDEKTVAIASTLVMVFVYVLAFGYFKANIANLNFNSTTIKDHHFTSSLQSKKVAWIYFTNTVAIALSIGLMIPWAKIRMAHYRADCLQLKASDSLDNFIAAEQKSISALGDQMSEVFDVEIMSPV